MDDAKRGADALSASDFPAAVKHFTRALLVNPHATDYYIKRSTAYSRLKPTDGGPNLQAALRDAEMAVALAMQRARREMILAAQMRRAITFFQLERFGDAAFLFGIVRSKVGPSQKPSDAKGALESAMAASSGKENKAKNQELDIWELKVKGRLGKLEAGDERAAVAVKEIPDIVVPKEKELKEIFLAQLSENSTTSAPASKVDTQTAPRTSFPVVGEDSAAKKIPDFSTANVAEGPVRSSESSTVVQEPVASKTKYEWYQTPSTVLVTIYAKGVPKDRVEIEIQELSLSVTFPLTSGSDFSFNLDPLYAPVNTSTSSFSVFSTKIEVVLQKQQPGLKWGRLESQSASAAGAPAAPTASVLPAQATGTTLPATGGPVYPTSSRKGVKDWDKLASSLTKKKGKSKAKDGESPSDADAGADDDGAESDYSDYGTGDPVDSFFKKLYANADPDTRRAMVKSYYESEGTALSTNWSEVSKGKVEVKPPSDD